MPFRKHAERAAVVIALIFGGGLALAAAAPESLKEGGNPPGERLQKTDTLEHQEAADRAALGAQSETIRAMSNRQAALAKQVRRAQEADRVQEQRIETMEASNRSAAYQNTLATVFNTLGMVLGVIGGTLLAGAQLTARQERISTLRQLPPIHDMATRNIQYEPVLNFFAILGSITLSIGFVLQLVGTLIASPLSIVAMVVIGSIAIASSTWILWFFLGQTHGQTRTEKLSTIQQNIRKNILQPIAQPLAGRRGATCEVCCRKLSANDAEVWWLAEENLPEFPYLHAPYALHYGHRACLPQCEDYALYYAQPHRYTNHTFHRESPETFIRDAAPNLRSWYTQQREYWAQKTNNSNIDTPYEAHLARVVEAVSSLTSYPNANA
ncbi:hypothetical protein M3A49_18505 [Paraburkholderia sp. CNPSo 3076]|uniref:hypothetical protein n=1 Tax=Paraburkholderia sp. CNPSo 3076 TaxID=2940936 RepID=UPI0022593AA5|nr:hypothetical protein [Paraburkholderia sp. CNPSo 3076]MCX5541466.1 hypothetical protein [Paraburkholderia sp. CNPSo 3076]